ncbi:MAG: PIG-L family deacetylase [Chloracidobacterium sp.]|nr:PIG-L family deacetylase [Chloracidobacterium sp.]
MIKFRNLLTVIFAFFCISAPLRLATRAQVRPVYDRGAVGLVQMLKRLNTNASALMIGAHPDDEDTALLSYLARGENARTAYLSLTRGDGGQNIIGPELGEALGLIRTEELLQARRLDGAEQYFTRAYDYGFSKTLDEAKGKWDEKAILCDAVRVIRTFRPLVVVAQFTGTPADGHGQHQFAGYIAPLAVKAANDASQCVEAGRAWQVQKMYVRHGFRATGEPKLRVNTGRYDPLLGRSYFEIAMEARSQHKSQEQGVLELRGDQFSGLNLVGSDAKETDIFEGIDTTVSGAADHLPISAEALADYQSELAAAQRELDIRSTDKVVPNLLRAYTMLENQAMLMRSETARLLIDAKLKQLADAIVIASGVQVDALADAETVVPGESVLVGTKAYSPHPELAKVKLIAVHAPSRWLVENAEAPKTQSAAFVTREVGVASAFFRVTPPTDWPSTRPYWLADERTGDMFAWTQDAASHTLPIQASEMLVTTTIDVMGTEISVSRPVEFRFADDIRGEIRRNVDVVPRVSVEMGQPLMIVASSDKPQTKQIVMTVTNHSRQPVSGHVSLNFNMPVHWQYSASSKTFELKRTGEKAAIAFDVTIPARVRPGSYQILGQAMIGEALASSTMRTVAYPHIQTHRFYRRAVVDAKVIDLKTAPSKVGYVTGSGDRVLEAIRQMGFSVEMISESELANGDLSKFDTVVIGIRAYQVRPDVVANNQRLLDYARNGGTLIVQYQLPGYAQQNLTPFPVQMGPRVTDENAAMKILVPEHAVFNLPNKIGASDFVGWVQERNLYNFAQLPADYTGLIESHDVGEPENSGGLAIAKLGKGNYVYCSLSMFRQLPAGVPGAYRLFANLLSLPRSFK